MLFFLPSFENSGISRFSKITKRPRKRALAPAPRFGMTELTWEGKYKDDKKVAPVRIALPFQTIETVNESTQERQRSLDLFASGRETEWRNRLIWGDKKYVLPSLLPEFSGKVNLIYIDPPFDTGADFSFTATIPDNPETEEDETTTFIKQPSILEQKAYRDTWGRGLDSYLQWFYETVLLLNELLHETGSLYVHLDAQMGHYARCVLDEVFGQDNYQNEIVWQRNTAHNNPVRYGPIHELIFYYVKSASAGWNVQYTDYDPDYIEGHFTNKAADGRLYRINEITGSGLRSGDSGKPWKGFDPSSKGRHWAIPKVLQVR